MYPESLAQRELILKQALQAGFGGGLVVDYPHRYVRTFLWESCFLVTHLTLENVCLNCSTKKKKEFLVLTCGSLPTSIEDGCSGDDDSADDDDDDDSEDGKVNSQVSFTVFYYSLLFISKVLYIYIPFLVFLFCGKKRLVYQIGIGRGKGRERTRNGKGKGKEGNGL